MRVAAGEPESRFVVEVTGPLPEIWADPDKLDQVIGNLVENAVRHGAGTVTTTVGPYADGVEVVVTDTLPVPEDRTFDKLTCLSIAPLISRAIKEVFEDGSVTSMFDGHA